MADENRVTGAARDAFGRVQEAVGGLTGDRNTQARGMYNQAQGQTENALGQLADSVREQEPRVRRGRFKTAVAAAHALVTIAAALGLCLRFASSVASLRSPRLLICSPTPYLLGDLHVNHVPRARDIGWGEPSDPKRKAEIRAWNT